LPKKLELPLLLELKPSQRLKQLLAAMHVLALAASIANALPIAAKLALLTVIFIHFHFTMRNLKSKPHAIKHTDALGWEVSGGSDFKPVKILDSTVITTFAIFLHFTGDAHKRSLLILNDALSEDDYRRLIVRLKTAGNSKSQTH
jgi:toxin CptA